VELLTKCMNHYFGDVRPGMMLSLECNACRPCCHCDAKLDDGWVCGQGLGGFSFVGGLVGTVGGAGWRLVTSSHSSLAEQSPILNALFESRPILVG
jgi:hypothetical protein